MRAINWAIALLTIANPQSLAFGAVFHNLDTTQPLSCVFSYTNHNRVMIESGSVLKVIVPDNRFYVRLEPESGQAFFQSIYPFSGVVTASVITDSGLVQDLEIAVDDVASEVIILRDPVPQEAPVLETIQRGPVVTTAKAYLDANGVLDGYVARPSEVISDRVYRELLIMSPTKVLEGPFEYICEMKAENRSNKAVVLDESELARPGDKWVYASKHHLAPGAKATVIFSMEKDHGK